MAQDELVESGHVLSVNQRGVVKVASGEPLGLHFEVFSDERDLSGIVGVGHDPLNAAEPDLLEHVGGRVEVKGHHLAAGNGDRGPPLLELR